MQENEEKPSPKTTNQNKTQNTYLNIRLQTTEFLEVNPGQKIHSIGFGSDFLDLVGFPGGSEVKASACNVGDLGSITGSGRSPEDINGNPLQYSCLGNPMEDYPWRRKWKPTPVFLPGKSHGRRTLVAYSPWGCRVGHDWETSLSLSWIWHQRHRQTKKKRDKLNSTKIFKLCVSQDIINKVKRQLRKSEKIFVTHISDKGQIQDR